VPTRYDAQSSYGKTSMSDITQLKPEHFEGLIGTELPIVDSDFRFTIKHVERLKSPSPRSEPFTLNLTAPVNSRGGQGIYHLQHPQLGVLEIFLVPLAPVDGQPLFEAVFN
jgi:hypothetical protein